MWPGFDPDIQRDLASLKQMVLRSRQMPSREWPLILSETQDELLVIREWPDGSVTAYLTSEHLDKTGGGS